MSKRYNAAVYVKSQDQHDAPIMLNLDSTNKKKEGSIDLHLMILGLWIVPKKTHLMKS